jgi:hypothetical protein
VRVSASKLTTNPPPLSSMRRLLISGGQVLQMRSRIRNAMARITSVSPILIQRS